MWGPYTSMLASSLLPMELHFNTRKKALLTSPSQSLPIPSWQQPVFSTRLTRGHLPLTPPAAWSASSLLFPPSLPSGACSLRAPPLSRALLSPPCSRSALSTGQVSDGSGSSSHGHPDFTTPWCPRPHGACAFLLKSSI